MRRVAAIRLAIGLAFSVLALTAYLDPALFMEPQRATAGGLAWRLVTATATWLTVPISLFGLKAQLSAPLFLAFAAPFLLRFMSRDAIGRALAARLRRPGPAAMANKHAPAPAYALPARVSVALEAAARARQATRCPRQAPPV